MNEKCVIAMTKPPPAAPIENHKKLKIMSIYRPAAIMALLVLAALSGGCASSSHSVSSGYSLEKNPEKGLVVYSTRLDDRCDAKMKTSMLRAEGLTKAGKRVQQMMLVSNPYLKPDLSDPPGYFFAQAWPAGEYRLERFVFSSTKGGGESKEFNVYFTVEPGVVQYLGEFYVEMPNCYLYRLKVNDESEHAARLLAERLKKVSSDKMVSKVISLAGEKP
jgi:hypothetical protein